MKILAAVAMTLNLVVASPSGADPAAAAPTAAAPTAAAQGAGVPDGEYVVIEYETRFENKAAAVETITPMKEKDGTWKVSGYYIH